MSQYLILKLVIVGCVVFVVVLKVVTTMLANPVIPDEFGRVFN